VSNYLGDYNKLSNSSVTLGYPTEDFTQEGADTTAKLLLDIVPTSGTSVLTKSAGGGNYSVEDIQLTYRRDTLNDQSLIDPFSTNVHIDSISIIDGDGITSTATSLSPAIQPVGHEMRMGRLQLNSATGVETQPLLMPLRTEYWKGGGFIENTDDTCTPTALGGVTYINNSAPISLTGTLPATTGANSVGVIGGVLEHLSISPAPGKGNTGSIDFSINLNASGADLPHLRDKKNNTDDDSNVNDVYDDNPAARATFRSVGGGSKERNFIFMRESR